MSAVKYFSIDECKQIVFPYIYVELTATEQAPQYEHEANGMAELGKVLEFVQNDVYYPSFDEKSSYLICSIAGSQYFSNGNKRLSVSVLLAFLTLNEVLVTDSPDTVQIAFTQAFPNHVWEEHADIAEPHSLILYNLAIAIGNRNVWGTNDFSAVRQKYRRCSR